MSYKRNVEIDCPFCGKHLHTNGIQQHINACHKEENWVYITKIQRSNRKYKLNHDGLTCQFCGKEFKNRNGLCTHERLCKENPDRQLNGFLIAKQNGTLYNPQKGKTKEKDPEYHAKHYATYKKNLDLGLHKSNSHPQTKETKEKISKTMSEKELGGINSKRFIYKGENLQSSYELQVAQSLDENDIKWFKCHKAFPYLDLNNIKRHYIPDFYLPEYDVYLDPKNDYLINEFVYEGFTTSDKIKWVEKENNIKVIILDKNHLYWDAIKTLL